MTVYDDREIVKFVNESKPRIVAIDAPLMKEVKKVKIRNADRVLKKYGAMAPTMPSMTMLAKRANNLVKKLNARVIEVFPTASAKILGIHDRNYKKMAEKVGINIVNKHELDAYLAAYTAHLYLLGKAEKVGKNDKIIIPKVF